MVEKNQGRQSKLTVLSNTGISIHQTFRNMDSKIHGCLGGGAEETIT